MQNVINPDTDIHSSYRYPELSPASTTEQPDPTTVRSFRERLFGDGGINVGIVGTTIGLSALVYARERNIEASIDNIVANASVGALLLAAYNLPPLLERAAWGRDLVDRSRKATQKEILVSLEKPKIRELEERVARIKRLNQPK